VAHRRRIVPRSSRALRTWAGQPFPTFGVDIVPAAGLISPGLKAFGGILGTDVTILRTRGLLSAHSDSTLATPLALQIALGIGLCTEEAALAGAVPLPFDNPEWDGWFVYQVMGMDQNASSSNTLFVYNSMTIDSKAMRKQQAGQVLFLATQMFAGSGAGGGTITQVIQARILLKTS